MTPGEWVGMQWWEQADIYLVGKREMEASAVEVEKDGMEELQRRQKGILTCRGTGREYNVSNLTN